jgi:hypothetical protein
VTTPLLIALVLTFAQAAPPPDSEDGAPPPSAEGQAQTPAEPQSPDSQPIENTGRTPTVKPFEMPAHTPMAPVPYGSAPAAEPSDPVVVERYQGEYEASKDELQRFYEHGLQTHFEAEQALMGALDGQWTVMGRGGKALVSVILIDPGKGANLDGAWRDLRKDRTGETMGVMESVEWNHRDLILRFHCGGRAELSVLKLQPDAEGRWRGEFNDAGVRQTVIMDRPGAAPPPS